VPGRARGPARPHAAALGTDGWQRHEVSLALARIGNIQLDIAGPTAMPEKPFTPPQTTARPYGEGLCPVVTFLDGATIR
jgi:hypothetical protein